MFSQATRELTAQFLKARDAAELAEDPNGPEVQHMRDLAKELIKAETKARKAEHKQLRKDLQAAIKTKYDGLESEVKNTYQQRLERAKSQSAKDKAEKWKTTQLEKLAEKKSKELETKLAKFDKLEVA